MLISPFFIHAVRSFGTSENLIFGIRSYGARALKALSLLLFSEVIAPIEEPLCHNIK